MMPDAELESPYDGAKKMILVDDVDNRSFCVDWLRACGKNCRRRKRKSIDFLVRMIDKYGDEVLRELEEEKQNKEEREAAVS